jgi:hypothetical protein
MDRLGVDTIDLGHRGRRYFVHAWGKSPAVERFLVSDLMLEIAQAALGDTIYLFNEQYVLKAAERGMKFGWQSDDPITNDDGAGPRHLAEPLLVGGARPAA